jgi:hypothetical protein
VKKTDVVNETIKIMKNDDMDVGLEFLFFYFFYKSIINFEIRDFVMKSLK